VKSGNVCSLVLVGLFICALDPSAAESSTPESLTGCSPRSIFSSATGAEDAVIRYGVLTTSKADGSEINQSGLSTLNFLGIRYAKGQGVKKNPGMAMRLFLRSAMQGYTPAMANLGTLYVTGAVGHRNFQRAYAWMRTALSFGVPEEDHDATVLKLGMIAARLDPNDIDRAERLARAIATRIVDTCQCSPGQETELAFNAPL
jgi:TPR repeat protein